MYVHLCVFVCISGYILYMKGSKNWYTEKVIAYGGAFILRRNYAVNFLKRELGTKRVVIITHCGGPRNSNLIHNVNLKSVRELLRWIEH